MSDLALNSSHDLVFENRDLVVLTGPALVAQRIKQRLLLIQGEWFLDVDAGLPWFDRLLTKQVNLDQVKQALIFQIANTEGVEELSSLTLELDGQTRNAVCNFTVLAGGEELTITETFN
jgi:hypothetical protein